MQTIFAIVETEDGMEVVGASTLELEVGEVIITEYDEDEYGTSELTRTFPVDSAVIFGGLAMAHVVKFPDRETAELFLVATTQPS